MTQQTHTDADKDFRMKMSKYEVLCMIYVSIVLAIMVFLEVPGLGFVILISTIVSLYCMQLAVKAVYYALSLQIEKINEKIKVFEQKN